MCALLLTFFLLFFQSSQHKPGVGIRKPLANITNTEKLSFQKEPKKTQLKKCTKEEAPIAIKEERCAHNHQCCISLQAKTSTQHLLDTILSLDDESNHLPYYCYTMLCFIDVCLCVYVAHLFYLFSQCSPSESPVELWSPKTPFTILNESKVRLLWCFFLSFLFFLFLSSSRITPQFMRLCK